MRNTIRYLTRAVSPWQVPAAVGLAAVLSACIAQHDEAVVDDATEDDDAQYGTSAQYSAVLGNWNPPPDVLAIGARAYIRYEGAPPWDGGAHCLHRVLPGTQYLGDYLKSHFPGQISHHEADSCRPNTAGRNQTSMHGVGRALDVYIPMDHGKADNGKGDPVANWLIVNAQAIGIQYIIWDRSDWSGDHGGNKMGTYTGSIPHIDHIHVELNHAGANLQTPWFGGRGNPGGGGGGGGGGAGGAGDTACSVRSNGRLYCRNTPNVAMHAQPTSASAVVNHLRTAYSYFECWGTGQLHAGGNTTWYKTIGDDNANRGWIPAVNLATTSQFDRNPSAAGLARCSGSSTGIGGGGAGSTTCSVRSNGRLYCRNTPNVAMHAQPTSASAVVNHLRTAYSYFECWSTGQLHAGGNTTWYKTIGDANANRGWIAAVHLSTTSQFDRNPSAAGLARCR
jgi:hypothetical protein